MIANRDLNKVSVQFQTHFQLIILLPQLIILLSHPVENNNNVIEKKIKFIQKIWRKIYSELDISLHRL